MKNTVYDRTDIYPSLQALQPYGAKLTIKFREGDMLVFIKIPISEEQAAKLTKYIQTLKDNRVHKGRFGIDKTPSLNNESKYTFVGIIQIKKLTSIGLVLNPFVKRYLKTFENHVRGN